MTAAVFGELSADGRDIILVPEGNDWDLEQIAARLKRLTPLVTLLDSSGEPIYDEKQQWRAEVARVPATWGTVVQLGFSFNGSAGFAWLPQPRLNEWAIAETIRRTSPRLPLPPDLYPPWLSARGYQLEGAAAIADEGKFLLLDEPGTGKTIVTILGCEARRRRGISIFPMLIVVPSWEVGDGWAREIATWAPAWPEPVMHRGPGRFGKAGSPRALPGNSILITTYATLRRDAADMRGPLARLRADAVIADEIHLARNPDAQQSLALRRAARSAATIVGASGTPITRNTGDVYPLVNAMDPRTWPSQERMTARFCEKNTDDYGESVIGLNPQAETEFFAIMDRSMRRVAKADVLDQLPPKVYSVRRPEIPAEWVKAYRTLEEDMLGQLPDGTELPVMSTLTQMMRLSQLASCAADVEVTETLDEVTGLMVPQYAVTLRPPSWKADSLLEIMAERPHEPVVCFTASRQLAMITGQIAAEAGCRTGYVVGIGGGVTHRTRQQAIDDFQAGRLDLIVCTAAAGGTGITLTRSGTTVFLQRDWPLDHGTQPEDRTHRIGQEHQSVEIIDVVARGTVEDRVRQRLREKAGMLSQLARDPRIVRELLGGIR